MTMYVHACAQDFPHCAHGCRHLYQSYICIIARENIKFIFVVVGAGE